FIVREFMDDTDRLNGYILLPDIFVGRPATNFVEPNTYGAIKELDYIRSRSSDAELEAYKLGGHEIKAEGSIFNIVCLVNNKNRDGNTVDAVEDLTDFLGTVIFLSTGSTGDANNDIFDNLENAIATQGDWYGKMANYCSYGVSEIVFPREKVCRLIVDKISLTILDQLFVGSYATDMGNDVENLIDDLGIREDTADEVINSICSPADALKFGDPGDLKKGEEFKKCNELRTKHIDKVQKRLSEVASENVDRLKEEKLSLLDRKVEEFLRRPGGLSYSRVLFDSLLGRLNEFQNAMKEEKQTELKKAGSFKAKYNDLKSEFTRVNKKLFGRQKAIDDVKGQFKNVVDAECRSLVEVERRIKAIEFFATLASALKEKTSLLKKISDYSVALTSALNEKIQNVKTSRSRVKPFTYELPISDVTDLNEVKGIADDFLNWLSSDKGLNLLDFGNMKLQDIGEVFDEYASSQKPVIETRNLVIDDVLSAMPEERRYKIVAEVDKMAVPLWNYDEGMVSGGKKTENIFIFGVPDVHNTIFDADDLLNNLKSAEARPTMVSTGDPLRVVCFKAEAALPAFIISNFSRYREKYIAGHRRLSFHVNSRWEEICPDLFPSTDEDDSRPFWSLGLADPPFGLIKRAGAFYRIYSKEKGLTVDEFLVDLGSGRVEAMRAFLADEELVEETRRNIEEITRRLGERQTASDLETYMETLMRDVRKSKQTKQIKQQVEKEMKDIKSYIEDLKSIR
ncbi:MAG: tubulin-like doman-containing protein, partial [Candidatus Thorarchaeota archaeon]